MAAVNAAIELNSLGVRVEQLDVTDPASIAALAETLEVSQSIC